MDCGIGAGSSLHSELLQSGGRVCSVGGSKDTRNHVHGSRLHEATALQPVECG